MALRVAREFTKMHIISSDSDCIAVVFYGTVCQSAACSSCGACRRAACPHAAHAPPYDLMLLVLHACACNDARGGVCTHILQHLHMRCMQRATKNANNFENVYVLVELEEPSARSIRDLDNMMGADPAPCHSKMPDACLYTHASRRLLISLPKAEGGYVRQ